MVSNGEDLPGVAAAALLTNAGLRKFMPSATWFTEQPSMLHAARVFWCAPVSIEDVDLVDQLSWALLASAEKQLGSKCSA